MILLRLYCTLYYITLGIYSLEFVSTTIKCNAFLSLKENYNKNLFKEREIKQLRVSAYSRMMTDVCLFDFVQTRFKIFFWFFLLRYK